MAVTPRLVPEVDAALRSRGAIVALESSVLAQGLPHPANREAESRMSAAVRRHGAVPAVTAVVRGTPTLGLLPDELERFTSPRGDSPRQPGHTASRRGGRSPCSPSGVRKASARDLPWVITSGADAATTVAGSLALCTAAGVEVFATGGIGGVHREPPFDESADLVELARAPVLVVCSGAKSILDLAATWERLETLGIPVLGYRTSELPGFYTVGTGIALADRADSVEAVARAFLAHRSLGRMSAFVVAQAAPAELALERSVVERAVEFALERSRAAGIRGGAVTPFLLETIERETGGRSLEVNVALLERNASLAAEIAVALRALDGAGAPGPPDPRTSVRAVRFVAGGG